MLYAKLFGIMMMILQFGFHSTIENNNSYKPRFIKRTNMLGIHSTSATPVPYENPRVKDIPSEDVEDSSPPFSSPEINSAFKKFNDAMDEAKSHLEKVSNNLKILEAEKESLATLLDWMGYV